MPGRSGTTFAKRQKEIARQQKQREKMERRLQRKHEKTASAEESNAESAPEERMQPGEDSAGSQ